MKEKIIARLKAKFSGVNLSKTRLDQIADKLAAKITDENEIDGRLDELNEVLPFADIAKQDDKVRTLEAKVKEKQPSDPKNDDPPKPEDTPADIPEWAKTLVDQNKKLAEELQEFKKGRTAEQNKARLLQILKDKKVDEKYLNDPLRKRAIESQTFKDDQEIETFANEIFESFQQTQTEQKQSGLPSAPITGKVENPDKDVSPLMQDYLKAKEKPKEAAK